jgi:hypothetical protein
MTNRNMRTPVQMTNPIQRNAQTASILEHIEAVHISETGRHQRESIGTRRVEKAHNASSAPSCNWTPVARRTQQPLNAVTMATVSLTCLPPTHGGDRPTEPQDPHEDGPCGVDREDGRNRLGSHESENDEDGLDEESETTDECSIGEG